MAYLSPVINHVHNKLNTHLTIKLNSGRYSLPAKETTKLDFDIMSVANGSERIDLFNAIANRYIAVDVLILKDGNYEKVGEYTAESDVKRPLITHNKAKAVKAEDIAKNLGVTIKESDDSVVKTDTKIESVNKVESVEKPALDPVKAINNPKPRRAVEPAKRVVSEGKESVLNNVKENAKEI